MTEAMVALDGYTFPIRHDLIRLGGRWDPVARVWLVPAAGADRARALVEQANQFHQRLKSGRRRKPAPEPGDDQGSIT